MKRLANFDLNQNELQNFCIQKLASAPSSPVKAQVYFNTTSNRAFSYNGTDWIGMDAIGSTMTGADIVAAINGCANIIDIENLPSGVGTAVTNSHTHSNKSILDAMTASFLTAQETKLGYISITQAVNLDTLESDTATNNAKVTNATHTGEVTGSGALTITSNAVTNAKMAQMATLTIKGNNTGGTANALDLTVAQVKTMLGLVLTETANATGFSLAGGTTSKTLTMSNTITFAGTDGSTLNIGTGGTLGTGAFAAAYSHPNHSGDVTSTGDGATAIASKAVTLAKMADMATASIIGRKTAATGVPEVLSKADVLTLLNVADGANNYSHPNHSGDVTSTGDGATAIANNVVSNAKLATVATGIIKGRVTAATGNVEDLTATQVRTLLNVADGANNYSHPTGDGNLHVPATSTTNDGKFLKAGASAGSIAWTSIDWSDIANKPSSTTANIDDAVTKRHTQNTDTGTSSATFMIGTGGPKIKNSSGEVQMRNNGDSDYADLRVKNIYCEGTEFITKSETIELADNKLLLNSNITTNAGNDDGGIAVKRLMADNTTRKDAELFYDDSDGVWKTIGGAVTGTLITSALARKVVAAIGDAAATSIAVTHNLNTRDCVVSIRETSTPYAEVLTDVEFTDANTVTFKFAVAPTASQYTVTIIG